MLRENVQHVVGIVRTFSLLFTAEKLKVAFEYLKEIVGCLCRILLAKVSVHLILESSISDHDVLEEVPSVPDHINNSEVLFLRDGSDCFPNFHIFEHTVAKIHLNFRLTLNLYGVHFPWFSFVQIFGSLLFVAARLVFMLVKFSCYFFWVSLHVVKILELGLFVDFDEVSKLHLLVSLVQLVVLASYRLIATLAIRALVSHSAVSYEVEKSTAALI